MTAQTDRRHRLAMAYLRHGDRLGTALLLVGLSIIFVEAYSLAWGDLSQPGPGLWPRSIAALSLALGIALLWVNRQTPGWLFGRGTLRVLIAIAAVAVVPVFYSYLGFVPVAFVTAFVLLKFVSEEKWQISIILAALSAGLVYAIFGEILGLPLRAFVVLF